MSREGTAHRYELPQTIKHNTPMDGKTPAQRGIMYYLQLRKLNRKGGATQAEIAEHTGISERSIGTAIRSLIKGREII
jgi:DNA-binding CsgD family transcriptional regulator